MRAPSQISNRKSLASKRVSFQFCSASRLCNLTISSACTSRMPSFHPSKLWVSLTTFLTWQKWRLQLLFLTWSTLISSKLSNKHLLSYNSKLSSVVSTCSFNLTRASPSCSGRFMQTRGASCRRYLTSSATASSSQGHKGLSRCTSRSSKNR